METIENQYITIKGKQTKEPPLPPRVKSLKELLEVAVSELERKSAKNRFKWSYFSKTYK